MHINFFFFPQMITQPGRQAGRVSGITRGAVQSKGSGEWSDRWWCDRRRKGKYGKDVSITSRGAHSTHERKEKENLPSHYD